MTAFFVASLPVPAVVGMAITASGRAVICQAAADAFQIILDARAGRVASPGPPRPWPDRWPNRRPLPMHHVAVAHLVPANFGDRDQVDVGHLRLVGDRRPARPARRRCSRNACCNCVDEIAGGQRARPNHQKGPPADARPRAAHLGPASPAEHDPLRVTESRTLETEDAVMRHS